MENEKYMYDRWWIYMEERKMKRNDTYEWDVKESMTTSNHCSGLIHNTCP